MRIAHQRQVIFGKRAVAVAAMMALACSGFGCISLVGFDPRTNANVSLSGAWTVMGAAPSADSCDAIGVESVRVVFVDKGLEYHYRDYADYCSVGGFHLMDTRANFKHGMYTLHWSSLDAAKKELWRSPSFDFLADNTPMEGQKTPQLMLPSVDLTSQGGSLALTAQGAALALTAQGAALATALQAPTINP